MRIANIGYPIFSSDLDVCKKVSAIMISFAQQQDPNAMMMICLNVCGGTAQEI